MTDMPQIEDMTPEQVRREIAERLGWIFVQHESWPDFWFRVIDPQGKALRFEDNGRYTRQINKRRLLTTKTRFPNWSEDVAAALLLCLDIARKHDYELHLHPLKYADGHDMVCVDFFEWEGDLVNGSYVDKYVEGADKAAEALSRLALTSLREDGPA